MIGDLFSRIQDRVYGTDILVSLLLVNILYGNPGAIHLKKLETLKVKG